MFPHQQPHAVVSDPAGGTGDGRRLHSAAPTSGPPSALLHCLTFTHSCTHSHIHTPTAESALTTTGPIRAFQRTTVIQGPRGDP